MDTGDLNRVQELIEQGTEVDANDPSGCTPLYFAVSGGHLQIAELLINEGADVNAKSGDFINLSLLHAAVGEGNKDMVELLIRSGAEVNMKNMLGFDMAQLRENQEMIELLTKYGGEPSDTQQ